MEKNIINGIVYGAFVGDALSLASHWNYDAESIKKEFPQITSYHNPPKQSYHPNKKAGELTHYGDQMGILLNHLTFDKNIFFDEWKQLFQNYTDYIDHCTKAALTSTDAGPSGYDISVIGRIAPLFAMYDDKELVIQKAQEMAALTHPTKEVADTIDFFVTVIFEIMNGAKPSDAITRTKKPESIALLIEQGIKGENLQTSCSINMSLPTTIYSIMTFENSYVDAITDTIHRGGDNAARAMIVGMVLGAYLGFDAVPSNLINELATKKKIETFLGKKV